MVSPFVTKNKKSIDLPSFDDFLLFLQTNNFSPETIYNYERDLRIFQFFLENEIHCSFDALNKRSIDLYKAFLVSRDRKTAAGETAKIKLSPNSINRILSTLRRYLKYLIDLDYNVPIVPESVKLIN